MKHLIRRALAVAMAVALLPAGALARAETGRKLTLMVYMCGSNLESSHELASKDIDEMLLARGREDDVSVLLMTGGSSRWKYGLINPDECQIWELIYRGMPRKVWRSEIQNMGSSGTLTQFLRYGKEHYPADEYALILWDHGDGPLGGLCRDELFDPDKMTLEELKRGIEDAALGQKLSWIGFDACLMGSLEVAGALEPYADYMIASQETEPGAGWDYGFLSSLSEDQSPEETARHIVDGYMESQSRQGEVLTLACLDLRHVREVKDALGGRFAKLAKNMDADSFIRIEGQLVKSAAFGKPLKGFGEKGYDLVDLGDLTDRLENPDGDNAAMRKALDSLVVYNRSNLDGATGVSVYHPCYNIDEFMSEWRQDYKHLSVSESYAHYIDTYGRFLLGDAMADWSGLEMEAEPSSEGRQTFSLKLTPEQAKNLSSAQLLVMMSDQHRPDQGNKQYSLVGTFPAELGDDGVLHAEYDGRALFLEGPESVGPLGYFLDLDGRLVTPVTYVPKEGILRMNRQNGISVVNADSPEKTESPLGTDTTPNVYYYIADAPDGARIDQVRIRDTATGMLSNRIAFSEEDYRGMVLWYPLKNLPEPDDRGLLPEYALWDDTKGVLGVNMAVPTSWSFSIRRGEQPGSLLWATFQVTDVQQNTCCTPPVAMENPKLSPVPLERDVFESQDAVLSVSATMSSAADNPGIWLDFELENKGCPRRFYIYDLVLNGTREVAHSDSCYLHNPDEPYQDNLEGAGKGSIFIRAEELTGLEKLDTVSFMLRCQEGYESDTLTRERVEVKLSGLDVRGIAPQMTVLASARGADLAWDVLSIDRDYRNLKLLLRIQNQGEENSDGETAWAIINGTTQLPGDCRVNLPRPGHELLLPVSFASRNSLGWVPDRFHMGDTYVDIVEYCLPDLLGDAQINQIDLLFRKLGGEEYLDIPLRLNAPYTPPAELPAPEDLWTVFHNLCEDGAKAEPLIQGPALEVGIDHLLVGRSGVGVLLKVRNLTDQAISLNLDEARIDGQSVTVGRYNNDNERIIAPGAETSVVYALGTSDESLWPYTFGALRLLLRCGDREAAWVELRAVDGPVEPAFGGTVLSAEELEIEQGAWDR